MSGDVTRFAQLGEWVATLDADDIPASASDLARDAILDLAGCTLGARTGPVATALARYSRDEPAGPSSMIGAGRTVGAETAAFVNASVGHALDFDDYGESMGGHPTVVVLPAALAVGELAGGSGRDLLTACVVAYEAIAVIGRSLNMRHYELGWHPTGTLGVFGAAAAAARMLRLDAAAVTAALTIAAAGSSGIKGSFGTSVKPLQAGHAARAGVAAAQLAAAGFTGDPAILEKRLGYAEVYQRGEGVDFTSFDDLGTRWDTVERGVTFKLYPSCASTHAPVEAALQVREGLDLERVVGIEVRLDARRVRHTDRPVVSSGYEAKFSQQYTVAAALAFGPPTQADFADDTIGRPEVARLMSLVSVTGMSSSEHDSQHAEVAVTLDDGTERTAIIEAPRGSRHGEPLSSDDLRHKFLGCCEHGGIPADDGLRLHELLRTLPSAADLRMVGAALREGRA